MGLSAILPATGADGPLVGGAVGGGAMTGGGGAAKGRIETGGGAGRGAEERGGGGPAKGGGADCTDMDAICDIGGCIAA